MSAKVSFRITTYWKRPRGEAGLTQMDSKRLDLGDALDWVLRELPEDAITIEHSPFIDGPVATIVIDWAKVPPEIGEGLS